MKYQKVDFLGIGFSFGCDGFGKSLKGFVLHKDLVDISGKEHVVFNHCLQVN